jgi:hypothetical protein
MHIKLICIFLAALILSACTGAMSFIPRSGGSVLTATYEDGTGQTMVTIPLPSGEVLKGTLIWIPPGGSISTAFATTDQDSVSATGVTTGNTGMYIGSIAGNQGTTMRIELLCNTWTMKCVGSGKASSGDIYDIQR